MQLEALQTLHINQPIKGHDEIPIFPLSPEESREIPDIGNFYCPVCSQGPMQRNHDFIRQAMFEGWSPKDLLVALKRKRCVPLNHKKKPITNSIEFDRVLGMHLKFCLGESDVTWRRHWKRTVEDDQMNAELNQQFARIGHDPTPTTHRAQRGLVGLSSTVPIEVSNGAPNAALDSLEGLGMKEMMVELLQTEMKSLVVQRRQYLEAVTRGDTSVKAPSPAHFNQVLQSMKILIGQWPVSDIIEPEDLLAS